MARASCAFIFCCFLAAARTGQAQPVDRTAEVDLQLRVVWGGSTPRSYDGEIRVTGGTVELLQNLGFEPGSVGSLLMENAQSLRIRPYGTTTYSGASIRVRARLEDAVLVSFIDPNTGQLVETKFSLKEVLNEQKVKQLDATGNRCAVVRLPEDRLRCTTDSELPVFEVGAIWPLRIAGNRVSVDEGSYQLQLKLTQDGRSITTLPAQSVYVDKDGNFEERIFEVETPAVAGAFLLDVKLVPTRNPFLTQFASKSVANRAFEFIAFDSSRESVKLSEWEKILELDLGGDVSRLSWRAFSNTIANANARYNPFSIQNAGQESVITHGSVKAEEIGLETRQGADVSKQFVTTLGPDSYIAIPTEKLNAEKLHRLVVQFPADKSQELIVSIKPKNASGQFSTIGQDYRCKVSSREEEPGAVVTRKVAFWPTNSDLILIANPSSTQSASVASVSIEQTEVNFEVAQSDWQDERMVGFYMDKPILSQICATRSERDPQNGRLLQSWQTMDVACRRLVQQVAWSQANLLVVKGLADGGSIFPSERIWASTRYDAGCFFSDGRCPGQKDVFALLLRYCEKYGVRLALALDLDTQLPMLVQDPTSLTQAHWRIAPENIQRELSRYDPLNPLVQSSVEGLMGELVGRYASSPAFAGIQLQLDRDSSLLFRGDQWGYSQANLKSFQDSLLSDKGKLETSELWHSLPPSLSTFESEWDAETVAQTPALRQEFLTWRARQLAEHFGRLGAIVRRRNTRCHLYLDAARLWQGEYGALDFWEPTELLRRPEALLLSMGIDAAQLKTHSSVVLLRGSFQMGDTSQDGNTWLRKLSMERGLTTGTQARAALHVEQPVDFDLLKTSSSHDELVPSFETLYPLALDDTRERMLPWIESCTLDVPDFSAAGSWLPYSSGDPAESDFFSAIKQLPRGTLETFPGSESRSVQVRTLSSEGNLYIQVLNRARWAERVELTISGAAGSPEVMGTSAIEIEEAGRTDRGQLWRAALPAYSLLLVRVQGTHAVLADVSHRASPLASQELQAELDELEAVLAGLSDPTQQQELADVAGGFEQWEVGQPQEWNVASLPEVSLEREIDSPYAGQSSVRILNRSKTPVSAWLLSRSIQVPENRRLQVEGWFRFRPNAVAADELSATAQLIVQGWRKSGERFEASQFVEPDKSQQANDEWTWPLAPTQIFVSDIPLDVEQVHVQIRLKGQASLWVDEVRVLESKLSPNEQIYIQGQLFLAKEQLGKENLFVAEQVLSSYWGEYLRSIMNDEANSAQRTGDLSGSRKSERPQPNSNQPAQRQTLLQQLRESIRNRWNR